MARPGDPSSSDLSGLPPDQVSAILRQAFATSVGAASFGMASFGTRREPTLLPARDEAVSYQLRIELDDVEPPIWRQLIVPSDVALDDMHDVLQAAMGWTNSHLHAFTRLDTPAGHEEPALLTSFDVAEGEEGVGEDQVELSQVLSQPGDRLRYAYDFGDGWDHTITLESVAPRGDDEPRARCIAGARACPPEDCGGPGGYTQLVDLLAAQAAGRPVDADRQYLVDAYPEHQPEEFSVDAVNAALAAGPLIPGFHQHLDLDLEGLPEHLATLVRRLPPGTAHSVHALVREALPHGPLTAAPTAVQREELLHDVQWMLDRVGENGLKLTGAGYLPPADVRAAFEALDLGEEWLGAGNRETQTLPVWELRELLQSLGLLRKYRGHLLLTKVGGKLRSDPPRLIAHLAGRAPLGKEEFAQIAGTFALLAVATRRHPETAEVEDLTVQVLDDLGWRFRERPITRRDLGGARRDTGVLLARLGLDNSFHLRPRAEPSPALVVFARMALTSRGGLEPSG